VSLLFVSVLLDFEQDEIMTKLLLFVATLIYCAQAFAPKFTVSSDTYYTSSTQPPLPLTLALVVSKKEETCCVAESVYPWKSQLIATLFLACTTSLALVASPLAAGAVSGGGLDYAGSDISGQNFSGGNYKGKDFTQGSFTTTVLSTEENQDDVGGVVVLTRDATKRTLTSLFCP
jgi:hypothetical protein